MTPRQDRLLTVAINVAAFVVGLAGFVGFTLVFYDLGQWIMRRLVGP